jgi:hypothetical protein
MKVRYMSMGDSEYNRDCQQPPRLAERLVGWCLPGQYQGPILGDLAEEFHRRGGNVRSAGLWYWWQVLKSSPTLLMFAGKKLSRSLTMDKVSHLSQPDIKLAGIGVIFLLPALILCLGGLLQSILGITSLNDLMKTARLDLVLFNPLILLGGLALGSALNLIPVLKVQIRDGCLIGSMRLKGRALNLVVLAFVSLLLATIFLYFLAENFYIFPR